MRTSARGELNFWWRENGRGFDLVEEEEEEMELEPEGKAPPDRVPPPGGGKKGARDKEYGG